jgi:carbonic anhydrase
MHTLNEEIFMRFYCVAMLAFGVAVASAAAQSGAAWDYSGKTGPLNWGRLDPAYRACSQGKEQSPIDIRGAHLDRGLKPIEFHYISGTVTIENTGKTIVVHVNPGSYVLAGGQRYDLQYFDFHHPSEEAIRGKLTDIDVHLVHKDSSGKFAIIAVRFALDQSDSNAVIAALWPHVPSKAGASEKTTDMINPGGFLPADRGYWTYTGSLTEPPCTEGVRWIVYQEPLSVSRAQIHAFTSLFPVNSRPLQDTHSRKIEGNE